MILQEQKYKNLYRPYYHGSPYGKATQNRAYLGHFFVTTHFPYAAWYSLADKQDLSYKDFGIVREYRLRGTANIFNAKCRADEFAYRKYCIANGLERDLAVFDRLKHEDWSHVAGGDNKRKSFIGIVKKLGYDGFFNYEYTESMVEKLSSLGCRLPYVAIEDSHAVGILNHDNAMTEVAVYEGDEILYHDKMSALRNKEMADTQSFIFDALDRGKSKNDVIGHSSNLASRTLTINADDVSDMVKSYRLDETRRKRDDFKKSRYYEYLFGCVAD